MSNARETQRAAATCERQLAVSRDPVRAASALRAGSGESCWLSPIQPKTSACAGLERASAGAGTAIADAAPISKRKARSLVGDTRGAVTVEYLVVFSFVGLTTALGIAAAAPAIVHHYSAQRAMLYQPYP